jgi:hypothetical protein
MIPPNVLLLAKPLIILSLEFQHKKPNSFCGGGMTPILMIINWTGYNFALNGFIIYSSGLVALKIYFYHDSFDSTSCI